MVKIEGRSDYLGAEGILAQKKVFTEIEEVLSELADVKLSDLSHDKIQALFEAKGWEKEKFILEEATWKWDLYRDKVVISIEFGSTDAIERDLLRALLWKHMGKIDVLVFVTLTILAQANFENTRKHIDLLSPILNVPVYVIGLKPTF